MLRETWNADTPHLQGTVTTETCPYKNHVLTLHILANRGLISVIMELREEGLPEHTHNNSGKAQTAYDQRIINKEQSKESN